MGHGDVPQGERLSAGRRVGAAPVVAVTGATGNVGSRVLATLAAHRPAQSVVALARDPRRLPERAGPARACDYADRRSLDAALDGVEHLVLVSSDGESDLVLSHHLEVAAAARSAGVRRVVFLSSVDADTASPFCYARVNALTEQQLRASFEDVRVVRAGLFEEFFHALLGEGPVARLPVRTGRVRLVPRASVADALATAVLDEGSASVVTATGPTALTVEEVAAGRGQAFEPVELDAYAATLLAGGESVWWTYAYCSLMQAIEEGRFA